MKDRLLLQRMLIELNWKTRVLKEFQTRDSFTDYFTKERQKFWKHPIWRIWPYPFARKGKYKNITDCIFGYQIPPHDLLAAHSEKYYIDYHWEAQTENLFVTPYGQKFIEEFSYFDSLLEKNSRIIDFLLGGGAVGIVWLIIENWGKISDILSSYNFIK